jgi:hypothetical protein
LRQYDHHIISEQVQRYSISSTAVAGPKDLGLLFEGEHLSPPHICAVSIQSSGTPITTNNSPTEMADCSLILPSSQPQMGSALGRCVRTSSESSPPTVHLVEIRPHGDGDGCTVNLLSTFGST